MGPAVRCPFILSASCTSPSWAYLQCLGFKSSLPRVFALAVCSAEKAVPSLLISDLCWVFSLNILSSRRLSWLCGRQNNICSTTPPQQNVHILIPGTCQSVTSCGKRDFAGVIKNFFFFFWPCCEAHGILVSQMTIEPMSTGMKELSPNHWLAREFPD